MHTKDLFNQSLDESVRFGASEQSDIFDDPDVRVGYEFEFIVNDVGYDPDDRMEHPEVQDEYNRRMQTEIEEMTSFEAERMAERIDDLRVSVIRDDVDDSTPPTFYHPAREFVVAFKSINTSTLDNLWDAVKPAQEMIEIWNNTQDDISWDTVDSYIYGIVETATEEYESLVDFIEGVIPALETYEVGSPGVFTDRCKEVDKVMSALVARRDIIGAAQDPDQLLLPFMQKEVLDLLEDLYVGIDEIGYDYFDEVLNFINDLAFNTLTDSVEISDYITLNLDSVDIDVDIYDVIDSVFGDSGDGGGGVANVKETLPDYVDMGTIEKIIPEHQENMVEVVSFPLPIREAFDVLNKMADYINDHGETTDHTGLHTNISIKGLNMTREAVDSLRLLLLISGKHIAEEYAPRQYVNDMMEYFSDKSLNAARAYLEGGVQALERLTRGYIPDRVKYQGINLSNLVSAGSGTVFGPDTSRSRVEFRFPGGEDYHLDLQKVMRHTLRSAYMLKLTLDEEPYDEYYKDLYRLWDFQSKEDHDMDFSSLINHIRSGKTVDE